MRPEMLLSGLVSVAYNVNRQQDQYALFEFGRSYQQLEDKTKEKEILTIWRSENADDNSFFEIKKSVLRILSKVGARGFQTREITDDRLAYGLEFFRGDQIVAKLGAVSEKAKRTQGLKAASFYGEIFLAPLLKIARKGKIVTKAIPKFPSSSRDLSLVLDASQTYQEVETTIRRSANNLLQSIALFDIYQDENVLGKNKKSYAVRLIFVDPEKNLKDSQIDKMMAKIIQQLETKLGAKLR